jgi:hypothetical protein
VARTVWKISGIAMQLNPNWSYYRRHDRQTTYKQKIEALSWNHRCSGRAINVTYCECVSVALVIQHAIRMRGILLSSVACPDLHGEILRALDFVPET